MSSLRCFAKRMRATKQPANKKSHAPHLLQFEILEDRSLLAGFAQIDKLIASDAAPGDIFGLSVAVSGDTVVVSAVFDDDACPTNPNCDSGSAYVFTRSGTTWSEEAKLTTSDAGFRDRIGLQVAVSGDIVVLASDKTDDAGNNSGSAYVFTRNGTTWSEEAKLTASDAGALDNFGVDVAISGDTIVVGARGDDDAGTDSGLAYVFVRSGTTWSEAAKLIASDAADGDLFGQSVAISGDTIVVGAFGDDDACPTNPDCNSGSAYVFTRSGTTWSEAAKLTASDAAADDEFGWSVALSGDTVVVGAWRDDIPESDSGSSYVFQKPASGWTDALEDAKLTASDAATGELFGSSVAVSGDTIVVGAFGDDDACPTNPDCNSGSAYVFVRSGTTWSEAAKLTASDAAAVDEFGWTVAVSGNSVVVGVWGDDTEGNDSGSAYVFVNSAAGDANHDGRFDQRDIVQVLQSAKYLTGEPATFEQGDWNSDGVFDQLDIVTALRTGNYLQGAER